MERNVVMEFRLGTLKLIYVYLLRYKSFPSFLVFWKKWDKKGMIFVVHQIIERGSKFDND